MKKILLTLCMALPILYVFGQSPGGVAAPDFWVKSDDAGNIATAWKDHSATANDIPAVGTWSLSPADRAHNFHPYTTGYTSTKYFYNNNNSTLHSSTGVGVEANHSIFSAVRPTSATAQGRIVGIDDDANAAEPGMSITNTGLPNHYEFSRTTTDTDFTTPFITGGINIFSATANNVSGTGGGTSSSSGGEKRLGLNGVYQTTTFTGGNRFQLVGKRLRIGDSGWTHGDPFPGDIMEVVWYNRLLTANEQSRVNSYLAMKNGVTLGENYLSASSAVIWDRTVNTGYNNNIFGLVRDDASALHQKQASSANPNQKLIIGNSTTVFNTNALNTNSLTNGQSLLIGDNGLAQKLTVPFVYTGGTNGATNYRFASVWKVQNTGTVGTVTVAWPKSFSSMYLIQSSDQTFASGNTYTPMTTEITVNGVAYNTTTVTLANGQFFTFTGYVHAPGGVLSSLWYRADKGVTPATGAVTTWTDYSAGQVAVSPVLSAATSAPSSVDGIGLNFNFNPAVTFVAANALGNTNTLNALTGGNFTIFTSTGVATGERIVGLNYSNLTGSASYDSPGIGATASGIRNSAGGIAFSTNIASGYRYTDLTNTSIVRNTFTNTLFTRSFNGDVAGGNVTYGSITTGPNGGIIFGRNANNGGDDGGAGMTMSETIVFDGALSANDINRVDSYLAIKGGITLNTTNTPNYLSSNSTNVWSGSANTGYNNNIFGIANDYVSDLHQKQSKSINTNQKLIIGAGNSLANTNALNTNSLTDGQFLIVGDNGLKQILSTPLVYTAGANGETNFRFESVWKAQNTGVVGNVIVAWPKGVANLYFVQSSDATFASGNTFTPMSAETTVNGVVYNTATVTLGNGQFFTFAGYAHAPGGVAGPDFWIKSDDSGAIDTAWKDLSLNADDIPNVGGMTLSPADRNHNFHPYTTGYTSSKYFNNTTSVMNPTTGTLNNISHSIFSAVRPSALGNGRITGIDNDANNAAEPGVSIAGGAPRHYEFTNTTTETDFATNFNVGVSNIFSAIANNSVANAGTSTFSGGEKVLGLNGTYATTTFTNSNRFQFVGRVLKVGYGTWNVSGAFPGDIMEVAWYKRPLSANEQSRVNSYLAVKNGVTLAENYLSTNSNIVWDRTNNTGYNNNIFGIAKDDVTALHQKQSGSVNTNQKLVISTTGFADNNVANTTGLANNLQFLMTGDNGLKQGLSIPLVYTAGTNGVTNYRFESVWKAQNTGTVGNVIVAWPKGIANLYLVQSADATFASGNTFTPMSAEVTVGGVIYNTATVTLSNSQFFTFAGYAHAPGGVINALSYWYRADKDAANTGVGTDVTTWTDFFSGNVIGQMGTNAFPKYVDGAANYFNFNPGVNFTAGTQTLGTVSVRTFSADSYDVFTFTKEGMSSGGAFPSIFRSLVDNAFLTGGLRRWDGLAIQMNNGIERLSNTGGNTDTGVFTSAGDFSSTIPSIMYHTFTANSTTRSLNGATNFATATHGGTGVRNLNGGHLFGDSQFGGNGSDNRGFIGHLGETIIYGAGNLSATERRRVDSYMAIKYGITLGRVGTDHYLGSTASATSIVWSGTLNAAYNNNIFGIARADIGGFEQKVSKSVNSGTILTIAKNNDFVSSNLAASRTGLPVNEGYLLLGDNNNLSTVAYTPTEIGNCGEIIGATEQIKLIPRKWLVQRTSSVGATYLQANLAAYTADLNTDIKMYVADDENFTQNVVAIAGTQSGNNWVFPYNFDGDNTARYITFGGKFIAAPCEQCKGGTYTLRTGYQWNLGAWTNQTVNNKQNILLGNDADGNPLYASMYADYSANPSVEYVPTRYPRRYAGRWTIGRRYDNTNAQVQHRIQLTKAMKASFQISNINTYRNNKNNFQVIGYCNGVPVMPKITYAYNTSYHTFNISGNQTIGTMSWRGFVPNVSTANVRFDRPVEQIVIICSVDRVNTDKTLRSILYSDITLECAEVVPPNPDNVYVSHSYTQDNLATCGGNTTMRIKVTSNNICDNKTINLHQALPAGLVYVPGSFNGNDLPAGAKAGATLTYAGGNLELSGLSLPSGEHWMYVDVANPGVVGTYPTQFTYEVTNGVNPTNTSSSSTVNLTYYQSADPVLSNPALTLSIKNNVVCGTNNMAITYRMKIDNPNASSITGAEILHMFDHDQIIQNVTYVTGEDEDGVITGTYPVDGAGATIDPINNNLFNLIDANLPVGVSYIDITVNTRNSYDIPDVQTQGMSSTFLVGFGSGECAESGEFASNQVVLPMCTTTPVCYKPAAVAGTTLETKHGITALNRAGADNGNWPMVRNGAWTALESKEKGFVINRVTTTAGLSSITNPIEGMMVYDQEAACLKIYTIKDGESTANWHCLTTQACPD